MVGRRLIFISIGLLATFVGAIGIWLPGLPTTPFILIALWAFSSSSPRLYAWLTRIPLLHQAVLQAHQFQQEGSLSKTTKLVAQVCAWTSFLLTTLLVNNGTISLIVGTVALVCSIYMWKIPTRQQVRL